MTRVKNLPPDSQKCVDFYIFGSSYNFCNNGPFDLKLREEVNRANSCNLILNNLMYLCCIANGRGQSGEFFALNIKKAS